MPEKQETLYMFLWLSQDHFFPKSNSWFTAEFKSSFQWRGTWKDCMFSKTTHNPCSGKGLENRVCQKLLVLQTSYFSPNRFVVEARAAVLTDTGSTLMLMLDRPVILGFTSLLLNLKDIMHVNRFKTVLAE